MVCATHARNPALSGHTGMQGTFPPHGAGVTMLAMCIKGRASYIAAALAAENAAEGQGWESGMKMR